MLWGQKQVLEEIWGRKRLEFPPAWWTGTAKKFPLLQDFFQFVRMGTVRVARVSRCESPWRNSGVSGIQNWEFLPCWPLNSLGGTEAPWQAGIVLHTSFPLPWGDVYYMNYQFYFYDIFANTAAQRWNHSCVSNIKNINAPLKLQTAYCRIYFTLFLEWWWINHVNARFPVSTHCSRRQLHVKNVKQTQAKSARRAHPCPPRKTRLTRC